LSNTQLSNNVDKLVIKGLRKAFGTQAVLHNIDLSVARGSLLALLGPSGSGKTTLLRLVCGFERADGGTIDIDTKRVAGEGLHWPSEQRRIGYVPQEGALFPHLSVADNIVFGLPRQQRRARHRVDELLELVGLPLSYADRPPQALSGGQQQRVALARALAPSPTLVMLDEPFSALDTALRMETREAVSRALVAAGATAILVTHDQSEALSMGDEVAVLLAGKVAQIATPQVLYRSPISPELAAFVGEAVLLQGEARGGRITCELGQVSAAESSLLNGPVTVMIRPEQIRLQMHYAESRDIQTLNSAAQEATAFQIEGAAASGAFAGCLARVEKVVFYGHDASVDLRLRHSGLIVRIRIAGYLSPRIGESVRLAVEGRVQVYPVAT